MDYKPAPRDTSGVRLPAEIRELTELLARFLSLCEGVLAADQHG